MDQVCPIPADVRICWGARAVAGMRERGPGTDGGREGRSGVGAGAEGIIDGGLGEGSSLSKRAPKPASKVAPERGRRRG